MAETKMEMARRIAADAIESSPLGVDAADKEYARIMRMGYFDKDRGVRAALAAIEECTERAAKLIDGLNEAGPYEAIGAAKRLRSGDHLKGPTE